MRELGNLAIACAKRNDVLLQIYEGHANLFVGDGPKRLCMHTSCNDDKTIRHMVYELNHGKYSKGKDGTNDKNRKAS